MAVNMDELFEEILSIMHQQQRSIVLMMSSNVPILEVFVLKDNPKNGKANKRSRKCKSI